MSANNSMLNWRILNPILLALNGRADGGFAARVYQMGYLGLLILVLWGFASDQQTPARNRCRNLAKAPRRRLAPFNVQLERNE